MASISFDSVSGIHEKAINIRVQRNYLLANNIANASTPGFKARDIDFRSTMNSILSSSSDDFLNHKEIDPEIKYRIPMQPSLDNNTVELDIEMAEFSKNNMEFMATMRFLNDAFNSMERAFRGE